MNGTLQSHHRDPADDFGRWYHVHLVLNVNGTSYDCAVDVDSHMSSAGVEWTTVPLSHTAFATVESLGGGYHDLAHTSTSGAFDAIRSPWSIRGSAASSW